MTTVDKRPDAAPAEYIDPEDPDAAINPSDVSSIIDTMRQLAVGNAARAKQGLEPVPIAGGTFAMYPMEDGGMMFVTSCPDGQLLEGTKYTRLRPGMLRAITTLMGGGSKVAAVKALFSDRRRAIEKGG